MKTSINFATAVALAAISMSAQAAIKLNATRLGVFGSSNPVWNVPLNDAGATTLSFNLLANKKLVLSYSAVCHATGTTGYVDIDIIVNGNSVVPTADNNDPFCNAAEAHTIGSMTLQIQGIAGNNTVRISAKLIPGATHMSFGNSALLVFEG
jgi:hypothetical protein